MLALRAALCSSRSQSATVCNLLRHVSVSHSPRIALTSCDHLHVPVINAGFCNTLTFNTQHRWYATKTSGEDVQKRIYYGTLAPRMKAVKVFSLTTSIAGLAAQPILMEQGMKIGGTGMAVFLCTIAGFFTFVTPLLLHFITKKYVTEIHYDPKTEEYTATTISFLLQKQNTKFRPDDVKVPDVPGMFTSFLVKDKPLFVDPALFEDPEHYVRIMGYDKPVDFKLDMKEDMAAIDTKKTADKSGGKVV